MQSICNGLQRVCPGSSARVCSRSTITTWPVAARSCTTRRTLQARWRTQVAEVDAPTSPGTAAQPIALTDSALAHLKKLRAEMSSSESLLLRVGVKQGGCSGLSYVMDFEKRSQITADDMVLPYDGGVFELVVDPKSLLYLFGMSLDHSDALIGGGFKFQNPNASDSCGCGKSFGV